MIQLAKKLHPGNLKWFRLTGALMLGVVMEPFPGPVYLKADGLEGSP